MHCCSFNITLPWVLQMHVDSWFHLGVMHLNGLGVKKNLQQALNYFASAAKYGHVLAQYNLAMLHLQNSGTEKCAPPATLALSHGWLASLSLLDLVVILPTASLALPNRATRITVQRGLLPCRNGCMVTLGWLKKVAERGPLAGVLQDALEWVCYLLCRHDLALTDVVARDHTWLTSHRPAESAPKVS